MLASNANPLRRYHIEVGAYASGSPAPSRHRRAAWPCRTGHPGLTRDCMAPLLAAVATGIIWSCWHHVQMSRLTYGSGYHFRDQPILGVMVVTITFILHSIIFGWLRVKTGSIWAPSLARAATITVGGTFTYSLFGGLWGDPNWIFVSFVGILAWIPLGILCGWIVMTGQLKGEEPANHT